MELADDKIKQFWKWFEKNNDTLKPDTITNDTIQDLNSKILSLGDFNWEIREGTKKGSMLIISPGGDLKLLALTKSIVGLAPELKEWEFRYHKPPKEWDYKFYIEESGIKKMIDASDWEYVLFKFPDDSYDIVIKITNMKSFSLDEQYDSVDIVLESILGEEKSIALIKNVEIVNDFSKENVLKKGDIQNLKNHILELEKTKL